MKVGAASRGRGGAIAEGAGGLPIRGKLRTGKKK